ncbi:MAG: hypothetical protein HDT39_11370 [Lachnospiraceae bacterium]|nr:hypothetical protein [Lachnospiraceae bacterium]
MKKLQIIAIVDVGIMVGMLLLAYITDYIQRHDEGMYSGLSPMGFWSVMFLMSFFIASAILTLLLYIIISIHFINKSVKPLKIIAIIDGVVMIVSVFAMSVLNYIYSTKGLPSKWIGSFLIDVFSLSLLISLAVLAFIMTVFISVYIIRRIKSNNNKI